MSSYPSLQKKKQKQKKKKVYELTNQFKTFSGFLNIS